MIVRGSNFNAKSKPVDDIVDELIEKEADGIANAGVGVSNGWIEYTGLHGLPADVRTKMLADIGTLFAH